MSERILSVIPARKGSKEIPRKNFRKLGKDPLIAHAINTSKKTDRIDHVVLTTDSQEIAQIGRQYGVDTIIDRPEHLATDEISLAPVIKHAFEKVNGEFEYVLCFQPTAPLVSVTSIESGLDKCIERNADSLVFIRNDTHYYWKNTCGGYVPISGNRKNRQEMDPIYEEIGVFLSHKNLVARGRRVGDDPVFQEVDRREGVDIDTYADWMVAESYLRRKKLIYRLIGEANTGIGHVYRGITIADHIFEHDVVFALGPKDDLAMKKLDESNYDYCVFDDEQAFREYVKSESPDIVVNDVLDTSAEMIKYLKNCGSRVVNFEDLGSGTDHADVVINALYEHSDPPENHHFGFKYFCLRNEFNYAIPRTAIPSVDRVMISFGGTDESNLTAKTLRALSELDHDLNLDVVLGIGNTQQYTLARTTDEYPPNISVEISQDVNSMAEHMQQADLLITSNGRTVFEAASLNLPVISIAQNQREQKHPYSHISRGVLFLGQANIITEDTIRLAVINYITDRSMRESMRNALANHDIANGVERIKRMILKLTDEN
jgi:CMP-N-acetylneuraminic acid synthetase/spore coat polysaccharide biosynthesis predicted glycosyltransferase SpsG